MNEEKNTFEDYREQMFMYMDNPTQYSLFELWNPLSSYIYTLPPTYEYEDTAFINIYLNHVIKPSISRLSEIDAELVDGYNNSAVYYLFNGYVLYSNRGYTFLGDTYLEVIKMVLLELYTIGIVEEMSILYTHTFSITDALKANDVRDMMIRYNVPLNGVLDDWVGYLMNKRVYDAHDTSTLEWFMGLDILTLDDLTYIMKQVLTLPRNDYLEESVSRLLEHGANPFKSTLYRRHRWVLDYAIELNKERIMGVLTYMGKHDVYDKNLVIEILRYIYG